VEAFARIITALAVGSATGSALSGPFAATDLRQGFAVAPAAALLSVLAMTATARVPSPSPSPSPSPPSPSSSPSSSPSPSVSSGLSA
jgi:hypothetical protein